MRLPRLDFAGALHHVMNRGARRQAIFADDATRELFLEILAELPLRFGVRIHGYALMSNHFHLMVETVTGQLPRAMRHLGGEYTQRLNARHGWDGPLFRGRYRNRLVATETYWQYLLHYVHLNPVRAGLAGPDEAAWTSHRAYLDPARRPPWLTTQDLLDRHGGPEAYAARYRAVWDGTEKPPAEFDPKKLWLPDPTGVVGAPGTRDPPWSLGDALGQVCTVTGLTVPELITSHAGRHGNPAKWLAAWWMSRRRGVSHGHIRAALAVSHSTLSQRIARVEATRCKDERLAAWIEALEKLETGKS